MADMSSTLPNIFSGLVPSDLFGSETSFFPSFHLSVSLPPPFTSL